MNQVIPFEYGSKQIRTLDIDGSPWFVALDVCQAIGLGNVSMAIRPLPSKHRALKQIEVNGRNVRSNVISEGGLYRVVLRSSKPKAEPFVDWVCDEVLPSIRKTGTYSIPKVVEPAAKVDLRSTLQMSTSERDEAIRLKAHASYERDEAIRTKAHVSAGREGECFSKVGVLSKENTKLNATRPVAYSRILR